MTAVSIVVCTKDRPELLAPCLRSIDAALAGLDGELVVVEAGDSGAAAAIADLDCPTRLITGARAGKSRQLNDGIRASDEIGRESGRERVCQYGERSGVAESLKKK